MGLFDKLFGKKKIENKREGQSDNTDYEGDWDFYLSKVDDIIGSFFIDLGLAKVAPLKEKSNLVWICLIMNSPREDGLSSNEEFDVLADIEDRFIESINSRCDSIYVGRLTTNHRRYFYFYIGDTTLCKKTIYESMVAFPSYTFDFGITEEKTWETYLGFLYPNPRQFQSLQNRRVVDNLEKNGDSLTKPRQVDHWIYFKTDSDLENFLSKIGNLNFNIISRDETSSTADFPFKLHIARIDKVDLESVDEYVLNLWQVACECNGEYDGWETSLEKDIQNSRS